MSDGAHFGYTAEDAMKAVIGGEKPSRPLMDVMEMRDYLRSAPDQPATYDDWARAAGGLILRYLERHPEASSLSAHDLDEHIQQTEPDYGRPVFAELTGFQWGWAVNAARRCLELPPVANPAILVIEPPPEVSP